ncbi:N1R/p28-like protein [Mythimna separata entomopoxvirus 'L']|uniref:N1R/p28-like protein n=1 Tax=Mythimna separata entomopoxvirus 'L' TaxID=1293572 RepID=A0A916KQ80_9POXV|nr:N1R/p28-like protein [Mythimna separata entomopoxvirus 'L']CCU56345.1 N1R/p28-like protein [Mythimna separata entomopoxvirus 'L']
MNSIKYKKFDIKIENNKYNAKDIFKALNHNNYEDNDDIYYSLKLLKNKFNNNDNERDLVKYLENNTFMDIFTFIEYNNYDFKLGKWFTDIWYPLFERKNIIITNKIFNFIYDFQVGKCFHTYNLDKYIQNKKDYRSFLNKNEIEYNVLKYRDNILIEYPIL